MSDHLRLDLNLCEDLAVVNTNNGANHLGDDDHFLEVDLDHIGFHWWEPLSSSSTAFDQDHGLPLEPPGELSPDPADKQLHQLLIVHVKELVKVDPL